MKQLAGDGNKQPLPHLSEVIYMMELEQKKLFHRGQNNRNWLSPGSIGHLHKVEAFLT